MHGSDWRPPGKAPPSVVPVPELGWKVPPRRAGARDPQDRVHEQPVVAPGDAPVRLLATDQLLDPISLAIAQFAAAHERLLSIWSLESQTPSWGNTLYCPQDLVPTIRIECFVIAFSQSLGRNRYAGDAGASSKAGDAPGAGEKATFWAGLPILIVGTWIGEDFLSNIECVFACRPCLANRKRLIRGE